MVMTKNLKILNRSNFIELLHLKDEHSKIIKQNVPKNAKYTNPQIQNKIIIVFDQIILAKICFELQSCYYFALIVGETNDISKAQRLSVVLRYYIQG